MKMINKLYVEVLGGHEEFTEYHHWAKVCHRNLRYLCTDMESGHSVYEDKKTGDFILVV